MAFLPKKAPSPTVLQLTFRENQFTNKHLLMFFNRKKYHQEETYKNAYRAFFGTCMRYCINKEDAKEVFNDALLKYFEFEKKNKVDEKGKYSLIKKIIINKCIDHVRSKRMKFENIDDTNTNQISTQNEAEFNMIREELLLKIQNFPPQTKIIFNLYIFEGWSHKEIAAHLGITVNTTSWHVNQGKQKILNLLTKSNVA